MRRNRFWIIVIGVMAALSVVALVVMQLSKRDGNIVQVKQNGAVLYELPLWKDDEIEVPAKNGGYNVIVIKNGDIGLHDTDPNRFIACAQHIDRSQ